jgi:hypothetical protein
MRSPITALMNGSTPACAGAAALLLVAFRCDTAAAFSEAESDGVYGRFRGNTDLSLKLGGMLSHARLAGSVGASAHYYSTIGIVGDYSESLVADSLHTRSLSIGTELRPLFLPRWALGLERGPAWVDLMLDSLSLGFGAFFVDAGSGFSDSRGVWLSLGLGFPVLGDASGPWVEVRELRRIPDHAYYDSEPHNALFLYVSWHHVLQLASAEAAESDP